MIDSLNICRICVYVTVKLGLFVFFTCLYVCLENTLFIRKLESNWVWWLFTNLKLLWIKIQWTSLGLYMFFSLFWLEHFVMFYVKRVPTVGGSSLDLHRLFVEVTSRGGIAKVWWVYTFTNQLYCYLLIWVLKKIVFFFFLLLNLKVIKDRRWREVIGAFNFPNTITSASFVLRRYYFKFLFQMEHVYYLDQSVSTMKSAGLVQQHPTSFFLLPFTL